VHHPSRWAVSWAFATLRPGRLEHAPKKLLDFFDSDPPAVWICAIPIQSGIPGDREALEQEVATSGAKAAQVVFLNVIHNFL